MRTVRIENSFNGATLRNVVIPGVQEVPTMSGRGELSSVLLRPDAKRCPHCNSALEVAALDTGELAYACAESETCGRMFLVDYGPHDWNLVDWVLPNVAIGTLRQAQAPRVLKREGVDWLMCVRGPFPRPCEEYQGRTVYFPLDDGKPVPPGYWHEPVAWLIDMMKGAGKVLVYCAAGVSRSPTVVAVAMVKAKRAPTFLEAVIDIQRVRMMAGPHPALVQSAREYLKEGAHGPMCKGDTMGKRQ